MWIVSDLGCSLDKLMRVRDVYEHVDDHVECIEKKGWGVKDAFENLQTIRGVLELWQVTSSAEGSDSILLNVTCLQPNPLHGYSGMDGRRASCVLQASMNVYALRSGLVPISCRKSLREVYAYSRLWYASKICPPSLSLSENRG